MATKTDTQIYRVEVQGARARAELNKLASSFRGVRSAGEQIGPGVATGAKKASEALESMNRTMERVQRTLVAFIAVTIGREMIYGFQRLIGMGIQYNAMLEDTRVGIASLIASVYEFRDAQGEVIVGAEKFDAAMVVAEKTQRRLQAANLASAATYGQMVRAYQQAIVPASQSGMSVEEVEKISLAFVQAAQAMGDPRLLSQMGEEVRNVLSGHMTERTTRLAPLITAGLGVADINEANEKLRELRKTGELYEVLMAALANTQEGANRSLKNFSTILSNTIDALEITMGLASEVLFVDLKETLQDIQDFLVTIGRDAEGLRTITVNPEAVSLLRKAAKIVEVLLSGTKKLAALFYATWKAIPAPIWEVVGALSMAVLKIGAFTLAVKGLVSAIKLVGWTIRASLGTKLWSDLYDTNVKPFFKSMFVLFDLAGAKAIWLGGTIAKGMGWLAFRSIVPLIDWVAQLSYMLTMSLGTSIVKVFTAWAAGIELMVKGAMRFTITWQGAWATYIRLATAAIALPFAPKIAIAIGLGAAFSRAWTGAWANFRLGAMTALGVVTTTAFGPLIGIAAVFMANWTTAFSWFKTQVVNVALAANISFMSWVKYSSASSMGMFTVTFSKISTFMKATFASTWTAFRVQAVSAIAQVKAAMVTLMAVVRGLSSVLLLMWMGWEMWKWIKDLRLLGSEFWKIGMIVTAVKFFIKQSLVAIGAGFEVWIVKIKEGVASFLLWISEKFAWVTNKIETSVITLRQRLDPTYGVEEAARDVATRNAWQESVIYWKQKVAEIRAELGPLGEDIAAAFEGIRTEAGTALAKEILNSKDSLDSILKGIEDFDVSAYDKMNEELEDADSITSKLNSTLKTTRKLADSIGEDIQKTTYELRKLRLERDDPLAADMLEIEQERIEALEKYDEKLEELLLTLASLREKGAGALPEYQETVAAIEEIRGQYQKLDEILAQLETRKKEEARGEFAQEQREIAAKVAQYKQEWADAYGNRVASYTAMAEKIRAQMKVISNDIEMDEEEAIQRLRILREELRLAQLRARGTALQGFIYGAKEITRDMETTFELGEKLAEGSAEYMADAFSTIFADSVKNELKSVQDYFLDFAQSILSAFNNMLANMMASWIMSGIGSMFGPPSLGGGPSAVVGPSAYHPMHSTELRAEGGPVSSGRPYIVGEKGPELFIPDKAGQIVPNASKSGIPIQSGGTKIKIVINNQTGTPVQAVAENPRFDAGELVIGIVMEAIRTNRMGMREMLQGGKV